MRTSFRMVPLELPRSRTTHPSSASSTSACNRLTERSSSAISSSDKRPIRRWQDEVHVRGIGSAPRRATGRRGGFAWADDIETLASVGDRHEFRSRYPTADPRSAIRYVHSAFAKSLWGQTDRTRKCHANGDENVSQRERTMRDGQRLSDKFRHRLRVIVKIRVAELVLFRLVRLAVLDEFHLAVLHEPDPAGVELVLLGLRIEPGVLFHLQEVLEFEPAEGILRGLAWYSRISRTGPSVTSKRSYPVLTAKARGKGTGLLVLPSLLYSRPTPNPLPAGARHRQLRISPRPCRPARRPVVARNLAVRVLVHVFASKRSWSAC